MDIEMNARAGPAPPPASPPREIDHAQLIAELPEIEKMPTQDRIQLARNRRANQLAVNRERERALPPPRPKRQRLRFKSEIELLDATNRNDPQEVLRLLQTGANPNSHNEDGLTPLHQCAIDDNCTIMEILLDHGADVNARDTESWTPLHAAACCAHINAVRKLIDHNANLLAVNADGNMPYDICDDDGTLDVIEGEMAAHGITQEFIDMQRGAAEKEMLDDMKQLHQLGRPELDRRQPDGSTYLHMAAANGYYDVAAFLLRCAVSPNNRDDDLWTPVHAAACWAQPDLVELLCDYGGDITAKTGKGETPMDLCEDVTTRALIANLQTMEAKKRQRGGFGVRDSRRQSRRRKKFESPGQAVVAEKNPFSARGAIRRQSLRDRSGITPARIEAQSEAKDLMRSWSKEDLSGVGTEGAKGSAAPQGGPGGITSTPAREGSPSKRVLRGGNKPKPMSPDEWLRKLERGEEDEDDTPTRGGKRFGRGSKNEGSALANGGSPVPGRRKKTCCCVIC